MTRYHELLGVPPGASEDEIKEAYREMVQVWHPDRFAFDAALQKKAHKRLQEINHAFEELSKPAVRLAAQSPEPAIFAHQPASRTRGPWPAFLVLGLMVVSLGYWLLHSTVDQRAIDLGMLSQDSAAPSATGMNRYSLNSASGKELYIIEGPRPPLDWEIDALVRAYTSRTPRVKQSLGNFSISQTSKPGTGSLIPLRYRVGEK